LEQSAALALLGEFKPVNGAPNLTLSSTMFLLKEIMQIKLIPATF
jgi:hypothetical protein